MTRVLVSVRGFLTHPRVLEVNLKTQQLARVIEIDSIEWDFVPETKRGFAGLGWWKEHLVAATWDRLCFIDPVTGHLQMMITDRRFSDLHGLHIEEDGTIWVANTNLDGVYTVSEGSVEPFWHTWECPQLGPIRPWHDADYRHTEKDASPYHHYHVNAVFPTRDYVYVSHLGLPTDPQRLRWRLLRRLGVDVPLERGGVFVLERQTRKLVKRLRSRGLHDSTFSQQHNAMFFTEFSGNALRCLDLARGTWRRIPLDISPFSICGYMTRGVLVQDKSFWVGHTVTRHEHLPSSVDNIGRLRCYTFDGQWKGKDIALPGYIGVFDMIQYPPSFGLAGEADRP